MAYLVQGSGMAIAAVKTGDYRAFACVQQVIFRVETGLLETSTTSTGPYRTFKPDGLTKWSITLNGVTYLRDQSTTKNFALDSVTQQIRNDGYDVKITFTDEGGYANTITGFCYIPYTEITGGASNPFSKWTVELQGSGEFELNVTPEPICEIVNTFRYTSTAGGETSITDATLIARTHLLAFRTTDEFKIITTGTPGNQEILYNSATGGLSWSADNPLNIGERITFTYKS
jgi:hypothetical protein